MKRTIAIALAAGALAAPAAALAQQVVLYPAPAPQAGVSYYCSNPQGWYPAVGACSATWMAYSQPQTVVTVVPGGAPPAQAGVTYWCGSPQGWYPSVQRCTVAWVPYTQTATVVMAAPPATAPAYVVIAPQAAVDPASAVYYVGPYRNAPYQSGILP